MKTEKNILVAFLLNLTFSLFEFFGGAWTGSTAIISDAVHDLGDAVSIGISFLLERKSHRRADDVFTYGYVRYSVMGSVLTTVILMVGSSIAIVHAVNRLVHPVTIHYDGMIVLALLGVVINAVAAYFTRDDDSINQKAVNLHMMEDVLGWAVVLVGAILMRLTDIAVLDSLMSIGTAIFILVSAAKTLGEALNLLLEKAPSDIRTAELQEHLQALDGVISVHHIHLWSMDGQNHCATMHIVTEADGKAVKSAVRQELREHGIGHATLELETPDEHCEQEACSCEISPSASHHHHHHHHHH